MSKKKKDWKTEKDRLLQLNVEERRKEYRRQDFISLENIPSWRMDNSHTKEVLTGGRGLSDKVSLYKGDITVLEVDAIVNAANSSLLGGGGVDGCIHKAAGSCLYDECLSLNGCETGKAKITCGYDLPAKYVIHTVGPVAHGNVGTEESRDLASCYKNSLKLMEDNHLSTVAFPCISTGIYGFPNIPAADIALTTVKSWIEENPKKITRVIFCVFLDTDFDIYKEKMSQVFQGKEEESEEEDEEEEEEDEEEDEEEEEQEEDKAAVKYTDVEMLSQKQDEELEQAKQGQDKDETENQAIDEDKGTEICIEEKDNDEDKTIDSNKCKDDVKEEDPPAAQTDEDDTQMAMEDDMQDHVMSSPEVDSVPSDSAQSKDPVEKKE